MYRTREGRGPAPLTISLIAMAMVFGGYLLWTGFIEWMDENTQESRDRQETVVFSASETAEAVFGQPTIVLFPTPTPIPECEYFYVRGPQSAWVRACPSLDCEQVDYIDADVDVCVIGRANDPDYPDADEWYAILLDPDEILPEIYYMNEIVLRPRNPTPTLAPTREPFPTITPLATLANPTQDEAAPTPSLTPPAPDGTETETGIEF